MAKMDDTIHHLKELRIRLIIVIGCFFLTLCIGFWISPILFKLETFRNALPGIDYLNPVAGIIINARNVMLYQKPPEWQLFLFDYAYAIVILSIGTIMLNKIGARAAEKL